MSLLSGVNFLKQKFIVGPPIPPRFPKDYPRPRDSGVSSPRPLSELLNGVVLKQRELPELSQSEGRIVSRAELLDREVEKVFKYHIQVIEEDEDPFSKKFTSLIPYSHKLLKGGQA